MAKTRPSLLHKHIVLVRKYITPELITHDVVVQQCNYDACTCRAAPSRCARHVHTSHHATARCMSPVTVQQPRFGAGIALIIRLYTNDVHVNCTAGARIVCHICTPCVVYVHEIPHLRYCRILCFHHWWGVSVCTYEKCCGGGLRCQFVLREISRGKWGTILYLEKFSRVYLY